MVVPMGERSTETLRWAVGDVTIDRVEARVVAVPHGSISTLVTPEVVDEHRPWIDPFVTGDGRIVLSLHSFVVRSGDVTIVVDTCVGDHGERPLPPDPEFGEALAASIDGGLDAVDIVLCTHLHFDHVGWNTRRDPASGALVPTFANARYLVTQAELDAIAVDDHHGIAPVSVDPLVAAGRLTTVEPDGHLTGDVRLVPTPGHSPGHVSVLVESEGASALITGDIVHSPLQFVRPEIAADRFDADADAATASRRRVIDMVADTGTIVLGTHFPPPTAGRIDRIADGGVTFTPLPIGGPP
jgi:glyoxylase-like metal-dependent hydrolase (beta-lactamase superfamily II)